MADVISMLRGGRGRGLVLSIELGMPFEPKSWSTERDSLRALKRRRAEGGGWEEKERKREQEERRRREEEEGRREEDGGRMEEEV